MTTRAPDWTPRTYRHKPEGRVAYTAYCSPACGFHCRKRQFDTCTRKANELCVLMGDGWTPDVFENCRWHWSIHYKTKHVHLEITTEGDTHKHGEDEYSVWLQSPGPQIITHGHVDPKEGLREVLEALAARTAADARALAAAFGAMP